MRTLLTVLIVLPAMACSAEGLHAHGDLDVSDSYETAQNEHCDYVNSAKQDYAPYFAATISGG